MKIVLLGYMASGKSTIGKQLSKRINLPFIDLDAYIEEQEKKTVSTIFKEEGEVYFRLKEHQYLKELLNKKERFILSLGGGTPCYANNMKLIKENKETVSVYLFTSVRVLVNRILNNKNSRPLVANLEDDELKEFIAKHLFERSYFYEQADEKIIINKKSIEEIVAELHFLPTLNRQ